MSTVLRFSAPAAPSSRPAGGKPALASRSLVLRRLIEDEIERLVALLDTLDGDPEAEDDGTAEPDLGWTKTMALGTADDREEGETTP